MAKQVFLLVESVYAEEGPGDGIRVLGTFTSKAGALSARRASLVKAQATELRWAHLVDPNAGGFGGGSGQQTGP